MNVPNVTSDQWLRERDVERITQINRNRRRKMRTQGKFPYPDFVIGRLYLTRKSTLEAYIELGPDEWANSGASELESAENSR